MKNLLLFALVLFPFSAAAADSTLDDLRALAVRCSVIPYHVDARGNEIDQDPYSVCPELQVHGQNGMAILHGEKFALLLSDSEDSDGDDLNRLIIVDSKGNKIGIFDNVLAYGNILSALVGGHTELFKKELH